MPHTSHIFPISDVACGGAHREVIVQELHVSLLLRTQNPLAFSHPWITQFWRIYLVLAMIQ
ncbi:hypothetical protein PILCRDRAFT_17497 [Piloderma croceum F 1598]|uniref:Uncharacterized protein n=1 Tax=Piloderma croceum (strain F 1598) TaxID=765440 RepID=A0A0C3ET59_PILCF|nr:hypothetical protein PILCRDRAFT_17497 [Piloderma croceum F 1598]